MATKSLNKVQIIGHFGADPEVNKIPSGASVANFNIATNESFKKQGSDEWETKTEWHRIVAWNRLAEIIGQYCHKGDHIYIEGRLQTRQWEDESGSKRYTTEVIARDIILLGGKGESNQSSANHSTTPKQSSSSQQKSKPQLNEDVASPESEDDIPF